MFRNTAVFIIKIHYMQASITVMVMQVQLQMGLVRVQLCIHNYTGNPPMAQKFANPRGTRSEKYSEHSAYNLVNSLEPCWSRGFSLSYSKMVAAAAA